MLYMWLNYLILLSNITAYYYCNIIIVFYSSYGGNSSINQSIYCGIKIVNTTYISLHIHH